MTRTAATLALAAGLMACRAPRTPGSGALVSADPATTRQIDEIIARVEPAIIEALGTSWPRQYRVKADLHFKQFAADTRDFDRRVRLGARALVSPEQLEFTLTHEIVHVHMTGDWRELPIVVQEGVANWIAIVVLGFEGPTWTEEPPPPELTRRVFLMSYEEYKKSKRDEVYRVDRAAMHIASRIVRFGDLALTTAARSRAETNRHRSLTFRLTRTEPKGDHEFATEE
jgi:hypothetical protein